jgi:hypothetical protein
LFLYIYLFSDLDVGSGQTISFILNDEYRQVKHIFGALCKFLHISSERMKNHELKIDNGQTKVNFTLYDVDDLNQKTNFHVIKELKELINQDKYVIVDLNLKKTIKAIKGSYKIGPKGENIGYKLEKIQNGSNDYLLEFKPNLLGRYRIEIESHHSSVYGSPFFVNVFDPLAAFVKSRPNCLLIGSDNLIESNI